MASTDPVPSVVIDRPGDAPEDVIPLPLSPALVILIRAARTFLQSLLGLLTAMVATNLIPYDDFLDLLVTAAGLAVAPTVFALLQNTLELLTRLDQSNPAVRA